MHHFDEVAKSLAGGLSRREAMGRICGGLAGGLLASLGLTTARAAGGNSACAHWCDSVFPPGAARGKCKSDAAHGQGLCYQCGPAAPAGHGPVCGTVCCASDQDCVNGKCVSTACGPAICIHGAYDNPICGDHPNCYCLTTVEGEDGCFSYDLSRCYPCETSADCEAIFAPGVACVEASCCGGFGGTICAAPCSFVGG